MAILNSFALLLVSGTLITIVFLGVLFIFFKVMLGMLVRLGLLAVLVAFSPLAFAFYASDATAHWTKKWVSMFLGATFQQVVVLVVIYIGIGIMGDFLKSGAEYGLQAMVVGMLLAFLTLALADSVPGIVNPGGKGMFGAYGQMIGDGGSGSDGCCLGGRERPGGRHRRSKRRRRCCCRHPGCRQSSGEAHVRYESVWKDGRFGYVGYQVSVLDLALPDHGAVSADAR